MKNIKYIAVAALALIATSCANFLEEEPKGQMVTENFFKSPNDLNLALNALYKQVASAQTNTNNVLMHMQGDDITINSTEKNAYATADCFKQPSDYKGVEAVWLGEYRVIQAANFVLDNAQKVEAADSVINAAMGNARFWRACAYFELVRIFGPLPINPHNKPVFDAPMSSVTDIYELIINDLETADSYNLPISYAGQSFGNTDGCNYWVTRQAVKSALAAVYMARAGYPFYTSDSDKSADRIAWYSKAATKAREVIDGVNDGVSVKVPGKDETKLVKYDLQMESDWKMVYPYGNNWSKEQLITISYYGTPGTMGDMNTNAYISQFSLVQLLEQFQGGWGDFIAERYWWSKFPEGPRKNAIYEPSIYTKIENHADKSIINTNWWATNDKKAYAVGKSNNNVGVYHPTFAIMLTNTVSSENTAPSTEPYDCTKPAYLGQQVPQNHRFIRYPEVICWYAEAVGRGGVTAKGGDEALACAELQKVMNRAYTTPPSTAGLSGDALAEAAWLEHGYEVTGYPLAFVTRRDDQFRLNRLKDTWEYRRGPQTDVLIPKGTQTIGYYMKKVKEPGQAIALPKYFSQTYTLDYDLVIAETLEMADQWKDYESMYFPYPPTEQIKNPNIKRKSAFD